MYETNSRREPQWPEDDSTAGLYLHIPFCIRKCSYCAFVSFIHDEHTEKLYIEALRHELELRPSFLPVDTIYFGGGTPSVLHPKLIEIVLRTIHDSFSLLESHEISLEMNPCTVSRESAKHYAQMGINRACLGVQSFSDQELTLMGRSHTAQQAVTAFQHLRRAGFENISIDLLSGYPGQSRSSLSQSLDRVFDLAPEHISVYLLEKKDETRLQRDIESGKLVAIHDDDQAEMYELICAKCIQQGYEHYEISNFARSGWASKHNLKYWNDQIFLGYGVAAHGMTGRSRYANFTELRDYLDAVKTDKLPIADLQELTPFARLQDALIMNGRLIQGIDLELLSKRYRYDVHEFVRERLRPLFSSGLFQLNEKRFRFSRQGLLLSNAVFSRWID